MQWSGGLCRALRGDQACGAVIAGKLMVNWKPDRARCRGMQQTTRSRRRQRR